MRKLPLIDRLRVGTACDVGWDNMTDAGRDRHCARCDLVVHDVSSMTRIEVEALLEGRERGERVCLHRVVRVSDGAVLVRGGYIERPRRAPPSRLVAAAVATATAMTACSPSTAARRSPDTVIAVAPVESTPPTIETSPASPALPTPTPPTPSTPAEPAEPEPFDQPVTRVKVTPVKVAPPKPVKPPRTPPPTKKVPHIDIDGDVAW